MSTEKEMVSTKPGLFDGENWPHWDWTVTVTLPTCLKLSGGMRKEEGRNKSGVGWDSRWAEPSEQSCKAASPFQSQAADEAENSSWQLSCIPYLFFFFLAKTAVAQQVSGLGSPTSVSCMPGL